MLDLALLLPLLLIFLNNILLFTYLSLPLSLSLQSVTSFSTISQLLPTPSPIRPTVLPTVELSLSVIALFDQFDDQQRDLPQSSGSTVLRRRSHV